MTRRLVTDPDVLRTQVDADRDGSRLVLGLDLGSSCGYCYCHCRPGGRCEFRPEYVGILDLSAGSYDSGAIRFLRLRHFLAAIRPNLVVYENVKFTPSEALTKFSAARVMARAATSSELIGAFRATVVTWCEEHEVPCVGVGISEIKRRATGKGNAGKEAMIQACNQALGTDFDVESYESTGVDNCADAFWVCKLAVEQYAGGLS